VTRRDVGPLVALGALVAGVLLGEHAGAGPARMALGAGLLALVGAWVVGGPARVFVAAVALGLCGAASMQRALDGLVRNPLDSAIARGDPLTLRGALTADPEGRRFTVDALVRVDGVDRIVVARATGDEASRLRVLHAGDRVALRGALASLPSSGFDARYRWDHAVAMLRDTTVEGFAPPHGGLFDVANRVRAVVLRGTTPLDAEPRAVLAGFLLGDTRAIPDDIADAYRDAGLSHLLAVSGANVAFVLVLCTPLLRRLRLLPRTGVAIGVVVCFAAATRFEPSVLRASALTAVTLLSSFVGRPVSRVRGLALAVAVLLLADPFLVHSVGFALSCAASAGIAVVAVPISEQLPGPRIVRDTMAVSLAAELGVTPVLLSVFGEVPLLGPVANLFAAPAAEAVGVFGLAASVIGGIVPPVGVALAPITSLLVGWVTTVARCTAAVHVGLDARGTGVVLGGAALAMVARRALRVRRPVPEVAAR
jgi:competence protein ComEC